MLERVRLTVNDLLEGSVSDLCRDLPVVGYVAPQVVLRKPVELDARALDGVTELFAFAPFTCRGSVPNVVGLHLSYEAAIDEATARCFGGLVNLRVETKQPVRLSWFDDAPLQGLSLGDGSLERWGEIGRRSLSHIRLLWGGKLPLDQLPRTVKRLSIGAWPNVPVKFFAPVWDLPSLESLALYNVTFASLRSLSKAIQLMDLAVSTRSLRGVEALGNLHSLQLTSTSSCPPLSDLNANDALRSLEIRARHPPADLADVGHLVDLERLVLSFGYLNDIIDLRSLGFLRSLKKLRELSIHTVRVLDKDISPVQALPHLRVLRLVGNFGPGVPRFLAARRRRKGLVTEVRVVGTAKSKGSPTTPVRLDGEWTIFADLTEPLGLRSNYAAEKAVRAALRKAMPAILTRVEFDSEAGAFSARTESRKDIDVIARILGTLIEERSR